MKPNPHIRGKEEVYIGAEDEGSRRVERSETIAYSGSFPGVANARRYAPLVGRECECELERERERGEERR